MPAALQFQHTAPSGLENGTLLVTMVMEGFMGRCLLNLYKARVYSSEQSQNYIPYDSGRGTLVLCTPTRVTVTAPTSLLLAGQPLPPGLAPKENSCLFCVGLKKSTCYVHKEHRGIFFLSH